MKKIFKKIKNVWDNDYRDILVPIVSIAIFIVALLTLKFALALIICILINVIYFTINYLKNKRYKKKINLRKKLIQINLKK